MSHKGPGQSVEIGYRTFSIKPFPDGFGDNLDGETDHDTLSIHVREAEPQNQSNTLLHEILHVIWSDAALESGDKEERIVTALANGMCQVIRDNPDVLAYIISGLRK